MLKYQTFQPISESSGSDILLENFKIINGSYYIFDPIRNM